MKKIDNCINNIKKNKIKSNKDKIIREEKEKGRYIEKYPIDSSTLNNFENRGSIITDNEYEIKSEIN